MRPVPCPNCRYYCQDKAGKSRCLPCQKCGRYVMGRARNFGTVPWLCSVCYSQAEKDKT